MHLKASSLVKIIEHPSLIDFFSGNENTFISPTFDIQREALERFERFDWKQWMIEAANKLHGLHNWNNYEPITIFNKTCIPQVKGRLDKLKWVWDCRLECDEVIAESRGALSREGAVRHALEDYLAKLGRVGLITYEQVKQFQ